jgi:hypothetical protein
MALSALLHNRNLLEAAPGLEFRPDYVGVPTSSRQHDFLHHGAKIYGQALSAIALEITQASNRDVAALTCIIFFCIECVQGNVQNALSMLIHGQNILRSAQETS